MEENFSENFVTLPKLDYYRSLRPDSVSGTIDRDGSIGSIAKGCMIDKNRDRVKTIYKESKKITHCTVIMMDGSEQNFQLNKNSFGIHLFDIVCHYLDLVEYEFFGITYRNSSNTWFWLEMEEKIADQISKSDWKFEFQVKFYPPDIDSLREDLTRYYLSLQIRQDLLNGLLKCSFHTYVILGAYVVQSETGVYDPAQHHGTDYICNQPFAPTNIQTQEMLERIVEMHRHLQGQTPEEADRNFLDNARKLALYGVDMHKARDNSGDEVLVGVYYGGILIYRLYLRLRRFSWAKITKFSQQNKNFQLFVRADSTGNNQRGKMLNFKCESNKMARRLWKACTEHHAFFRLRATEGPKKPSLLPGFATRRFQVSANSPNINGAENTVLGRDGGRESNQRPQPKVHRTQTQRKNVENSNLRDSGQMVQAAGSSDYFKNSLHSFRPRPTFPHQHWGFSIPDGTLGIGVSDNRLDVAAQPQAGWQGIRANKGILGPGNYYFEAEVVEDGPILLGWAKNDAHLEPIGSDANAWALGFAPSHVLGGKKVVVVLHNGKPIAEARDINGNFVFLNVDDIIGCSLLVNSPEAVEKSGYGAKLNWYLNGQRLLAPEQQVLLPPLFVQEALFPAVSMFDSRINANFGDEPFHYMPDEDDGTFVALSSAPDEVVVCNEHDGWRMNPYDSTDCLDVAPNGLGVQSHSNRGWQGSRANKGVCGGGKYYFEATLLEEGEQCFARIGWSTADGSLDLGTDSLGYGYGADRDGFGINGNQGKKLHKDDIDNYGEAFRENDVIGCFMDLNKGVLGWSKNGKEFGEAYSIPEHLINEAFFPTVSLKECTIKFNFGEDLFKHVPKSGGWIPLTFAANGNTRKNRKHGPEMSAHPLDGWQDQKGSSTDRQEDDIMRGSKIGNIQQKGGIQVLPNMNEHLKRQTSNSLYTTTTTDGNTVVKEGEPEVSTEFYTDEQGNQVKRTVKKRTTCTISQSRRITTERTEDQVAGGENARIMKNFPINYEDDMLDQAIVTVCEFNTDVVIQEGSLQNVEIKSTQLESEI